MGTSNQLCFMADMALMHSGSVHGEEESRELDVPALVNGSNPSDPHFLPVNAAKLTQSLIGLSDEQRQVFEKELDLTDEGPLLVLRFNPNWQGQVIVGTVCDAIATFGMRGNARRDSSEGCHGWIFHFDHYQDLEPCRAAIQRAYPQAFAHLPGAVADAVAVFDAAATTGFRTEPLAYATRSQFVKVMQEYSTFSTCISGLHSDK